MCGLAGIVSNKIVDPNVVEKMSFSLKHRGPDSLNLLKINSTTIFAHNRLSIIDLHNQSNQPFTSPDNRYFLVYNGEIYNYIELKKELRHFWNFKTKSDTEVLLASYAKWGRECLNKFNGMFAFCIWDNKDNTLFMARDRFGVKPLYYSILNSTLIFSSEIKALWEAGVQKLLNEEVCSAYLKYGTYGNLEDTFWKHIYQLPAGNFAIFKNNGLNISRWYHFDKEVKKVQKADHKIDFIKYLLNDSVKIRFRADVPVGVNLSGGVDSSTLLSIIKILFKNTINLKAFTFYTGDEKYDELPWVKKMINNIKCDLVECLLQPNDVPEMTKEIMEYQDEPFGGIPTIAYSIIFKKAHKNGFKVLLDGQGSDESWAGYDYYLKNNKSIIQGTKTSPFKPNALNPEFSKLSKSPNYHEPFDETLLNRQYRDLFHTKIPRALRFNDRISMMHSVELREPFLDYRLVENVFALEKEKKIKNGIQKWLFRDLSKDTISDSILWAPKRPLQTPQREWLKEDLRNWAYDYIDIAKKTGWFNSSIINSELDKYKNLKVDSSFHIWQWISIGHMIDMQKP